MAIYALVGPRDEIKFVQEQPDPKVATKPGWRWLPVVEEKPDLDEASETLIGPVYAVGKDEVTCSYDKTARKLERDPLTELDALRAELAANGYVKAG